MAKLFSKELTTADSLLPSVRIIVTIMLIIVKSLNVAEVNATNEALETKRLKTKYILLWTDLHHLPFPQWKLGQKEFIRSKCPVSDCYMTGSRDFFGDDVTKFNAVIFNGRSLKNVNLSELPRNRSPRQKYIFLNTECSDNQPICNSIFNGFFNWTATYKLDSDIVANYLEIINAAGEVVGPRIDMSWKDELSDFNDTLLSTFKRKTKAAAWFVSHCRTRGRREQYISRLRDALWWHKLTLDIYGRCGKLKCPNSDKKRCIKMLTDDYFFYLSFENSIATDYITEKLLTALVSGTVPIVFGGADYSRYGSYVDARIYEPERLAFCMAEIISYPDEYREFFKWRNLSSNNICRFLPYGSYIDATIYEPEGLASHMAEVISYPDEYKEFFRWRNDYKYQAPNIPCRICAALHNQTKFEAHSIYEDFLGWWNPYYTERCKDTTWGS